MGRTGDQTAVAENTEAGRGDAETFEVQKLGAMERPSWNDARLDDLSTRVDEGFKQVNATLVRMDEKFDRMDERFDRLSERFDRLSEKFDRLSERFDRLQLGLLGAAAAIIAALLAAPQI